MNGISWFLRFLVRSWMSKSFSCNYLNNFLFSLVILRILVSSSFLCEFLWLIIRLMNDSYYLSFWLSNSYYCNFSNSNFCWYKSFSKESAQNKSSKYIKLILIDKSLRRARSNLFDFKHLLIIYFWIYVIFNKNSWIFLF